MMTEARYNQAQPNNETAFALVMLAPSLTTERQRLSMADTSIPIKRCTKCGKEFPATSEYFYAVGTHLRARCKTCFAEYRTAHRAEMAEYKRRYRKEHRAAISKYNRYYEANHKEKTDEYKKRYSVTHKEKTAARSRRYNAEHKEECAERGRRYRAEHPEVGTAAIHRRLARKRGLPDTFTSDQARVALTYWQWKCAYCGTSLAQLSLFDDTRLHFDHFIPLSDKRKDNPGTVAANMVPSCSSCNRHKHNADPVVWVTRIFGEQRAKKILARIKAYFERLTQ